MKKNVCTALLSASLVTMIGLGGASFVHPTVAFAGDKDNPTAEVIAKDKERMDRAVESIKSRYPKIAGQIDGYYKKFNYIPDIYSDHFKQYVKESSDSTPEDKSSVHDESAHNEAAIQEAIEQARSELDEYAASKFEEVKNTGLFDDDELSRIKRNLSDHNGPDAFHSPYGRIDEPQNTLDSVDEYKKEYKSHIDKAAKNWIDHKKEAIELEKELGPLWYFKSENLRFLDDSDELDKGIMSSDILPSKDKQEYAAQSKKIREQAKADIKKANDIEQIDSIYRKAKNSLWDLRDDYEHLMQPVYEGKYDPKFDEFYAGISKPMTPEEYKKIIEIANGIVEGTIEIPTNIPTVPGLSGDKPLDIAVRMTPYAEARLAEYGRPNMPEISEVEKYSNIYQSDFMAWGRGKYKSAIAEYMKSQAVTDKSESTQNIAKSKVSAEPKHMKKSATPKTADVTAGVAAYLLGGLGLGLVSRKKN